MKFQYNYGSGDLMSVKELEPYFSNYGRPLGADNVSEDNYGFVSLVEKEVRALIESYCEYHNYAPPYFVFHNDFVQQKYKAYARETNGIKIIGITVTVALVFKQYFSYALAHRSLEATSDRSKKPSPVKNVKNLYSYQDSYLSLSDGQLGMAEDLARIALIYIAAHEFSHLRLGHCSFNAKNSLDYLAMETAADRCAADILMSYALMLEREHSVDWLRLLPEWLAAIGSSFRIDWSVDSWAKKLYDSKHPPAPYRAITSATQLLLRFKGEKNLSTGTIVEIYKFMTEEIERMYENVTGTNQRAIHGEQFLELVSLDQNNSYTEKLLNHHRKLFPNSEC